MYCKVCGKQLPDGAVRCDECGSLVDGATGDYKEEKRDSRGGSFSGFDTGDGYYQDNRNQDGSYSSYYDGGSEPVYERQSGARKGFAITSMVLGIIGLVGTCCSFFTYGGLSILLGLLGLVFGILGLKSQGKGMAIAGIVMAALNLIIGILILILMVISLQSLSGMSPEEYRDFIEELENIYDAQMIRLKGAWRQP